LAGVLIVHVHVLVPVHDAFLTNATVASTFWLAGVLIVHVHVLVPVHDAFLTNATVASTVWLAGVLIVLVPVLVPVHDAFLTNATVASTVWLAGVLIVHVLVPVHDAFLRNATVAAVDHPRQHRYDAHDQSFADAQGIGIENTAATEDVEDRTAFPRRSARGLVYEYVYRFAVNVYASSANNGVYPGVDAQ
jgi:hypothetical protein